MAHQSNITSNVVNVGLFNNNFRYEYEVKWLNGNAAIREVKIDKTIGAGVVAPRRFAWRWPPLVRDPRMDVLAPTHWTLISRPGQFEFMIQPPQPGLAINNYIPQLAGPPPHVPGPAPLAGLFRIYSAEAPKTFPAFTTDHLNGRFPLFPNTFQVDAPNSIENTAKIEAFCELMEQEFKYTYILSADVAEIFQATIFLHPEVEIYNPEISHKDWNIYRVGFDKPANLRKPAGKPTEDENGILYFGSWVTPVSNKGELSSVGLSFYSKHPPGHIPVLSNRFGELLLGPVLNAQRI